MRRAGDRPIPAYADGVDEQAPQHPQVPHALFEVVLRDADDAFDRVAAALRAERLVGIVHPDELQQRMGVVTGVLALDDAALALVEREGEAVPGLALPTLAARLSRSLDGAVQFALLPELDERLPEPPIAVPADLDVDQALADRELHELRQPVRVASQLRRPADDVTKWLPELALTAQGPAVLLPAGDDAVLVTDGASFPQWQWELRPVVALIQRTSRIEAHVWLRTPIGRRRSLRERVGGAGEADWAVAWESRPQGLASGAAGAAAEEELLIRPALEVPAEVIGELRLSADQVAAIHALWQEDFPSVTVARVADAFGAHPTLEVLTDPEFDAAALPGAVVREPASVGTTVLDAIHLAREPRGEGLWARWQRWWWRRPGLSIGVAVGMLALAAAMAVAMAGGWAVATPWRWVLVPIVVLNATGLLASGLLARRAARAARRPDPDADADAPTVSRIRQP